MCPYKSLRLHAGAAGLIALLCFAAGVIAGNVFHLAACPLCILQRMLYLAAAIIGILAGWLWYRMPARVLNLLFCTLCATGVWVSAYQSYLQRHPTKGGCSADSPWWENFVYWAGDHYPALFMSNGMCTDPGFKLLGLSIAEYSLMMFLALTLLGFYILLRGKHSR
ncbi:MAG: disulfide bond formation protein B [Proteobacteria bacterium]|nr:disulfide bond formation protein B [Pseudomonadota bacterium]HQR04321.1 disulfide bond formation protein B [Rhodocyclaceae bacterium]